ncbi:MAG: hypothetical protein JXB32_13850 [Deltaproteobacteria bacterium]|nr:hypothetical protein [Deltaproteobacteria bacterium]
MQAQQTHLQRGCLFVPEPDPLPVALTDVWLTVETPSGEAAAWTARVLQVYEGLGVALGFDDPEPVRARFEAWLAAPGGESEAPTEVRWDESLPSVPPPSVATPPARAAADEPDRGLDANGAAGDDPRASMPPGDAAAGPLADQIRAMTTQQRMHLAAHGDRAARLLLVKDPNKTIQAFLLQNPHITLEEVRYLAGSRQASPDALQLIAAHREWSQNAGVVLALVRNPKTPVGSAVRLLDRLGEQELRRLAKSPDVPRGVQLAARKKVNPT